MTETNTSNGIDIKLAHSPDSDDAFMFYALATEKIPTGNLHFHHTLCDIETLNNKALEGFYEVTAISFHAYPMIADQYALLPHGSSMGSKYGPMVIASKPFPANEIKGKKIAIPGLLTTAYLSLRLFEPDFEPVIVPFDKIVDSVKHGLFDGGLIIHEGQLTYAQEGLYKIIDLGEWWDEQFHLPLPLGGNAIRKDLGPETISEVSRLLKASIQYGLEHREEALEYAMHFARDLNRDLADQFVAMYVNELTLDYGPEGRRAVQLLLDQGYEKKIIPRKVTVEFVG
ncbi:MAG: ABC transporter substrate-binding protein [Acidobacteriia bacterium]|nr:ABC transporter substrate-binding protein [Terriglobia bacterium]